MLTNSGIQSFNDANTRPTASMLILQPKIMTSIPQEEEEEEEEDEEEEEEEMKKKK